MKHAFISKILAGALLLAAPAAMAGTLEDVKARGVVRCGVSTNSPGFAALDSQGVARGFDVDLCRAVAAAVLGDASKFQVSPLNLRDSFTTLATGGIDILTHRFTWTFNRDNGTGVEFVQTMFYDGQGFIVRKSSGAKSVKDLNGATICVAQGSTTELNIADYFRSQKLQYKIATFGDLDEARNAYEAGRCDAWSNDRASLAARSLALKNRDEHIVLPDTISKEPIGPLVRSGDSAWFHIVRWALYATIAAEELGLTSANVDEQRKSSTNPETKRLLGVGDDLGQKMGLGGDWAYNVIKQIGNYGEIYDRHVGPQSPLALPRGVNALWRDGGLLIAPPVR